MNGFARLKMHPESASFATLPRGVKLTRKSWARCAYIQFTGAQAIAVHDDKEAFVASIAFGRADPDASRVAEPDTASRGIAKSYRPPWCGCFRARGRAEK